MTYREARLRLLNHSNLPGPHIMELSEEESFVYRISQADRDPLPPPFETLAEDVLACLSAANRENRLQASAGLAYAISGIVTGGIKYHRYWSRRGLFDQRTREKLEDSVYRIAFAWDQLLAGDIDDLLEGIDWAPDR